MCVRRSCKVEKKERKLVQACSIYSMPSGWARKEWGQKATTTKLTFVSTFSVLVCCVVYIKWSYQTNWLYLYSAIAIALDSRRNNFTLKLQSIRPWPIVTHYHHVDNSFHTDAETIDLSKFNLFKIIKKTTICYRCLYLPHEFFHSRFVFTHRRRETKEM